MKVDDAHGEDHQYKTAGYYNDVIGSPESIQVGCDDPFIIQEWQHNRCGIIEEMDKNRDPERTWPDKKVAQYYTKDETAEETVKLQVQGAE